MQNYNKIRLFKIYLSQEGQDLAISHLIEKLSLISKKIFIIDNYSTGYKKKFPQNTYLIKANCEQRSVKSFKQIYF